jgi:hypothetical protein
LDPQAVRILDAIAASGCDPILLRIPPSRRGGQGQQHTLRFLIDSTRRREAALCTVLNALGVRPRDVDSRTAFRLEASFFRSVQRMALSVGDLPIDLAVSWPGIGTYEEASSRATGIQIANRSFRVVDVALDD